MKDVSFVSRESMYGVNLSIIASNPAVGALGDTAMYGNVNNTNLARLSVRAYH